MVARTMGNLYGQVDALEDVREINRKIRQEMETVTTQDQLTELKKRSDYLCTLTFAPSWRKRFGEKVVRFREVAMEENRRTTAKANSIARKKGFNVEYHAWRERRQGPKQSQERYAGGGIVKYLVYRSPQPLRGGKTRSRTRVRRLYFPADATHIRIEQPREIERRSGKKVFGVAVRYRYQLAPATARRGRTSYEIPERWAERTKIVELPRAASDLELTDSPPEGPLMAVA